MIISNYVPDITGVISFNGRSGAVTPTAGDYTAEDVGAIPATAMSVSSGVAAQNEISLVETDTATAAHAVGDYICWNGLFCRVTAAISVGDTLVIGGNVEQTTVGGELAALSASLPNKADKTELLRPQVLVTTEAGASVTATLDGTTAGPATAGEDGLATLELPGYGTWTVTAALGEDVISDPVSVTEVRQYEIALPFRLYLFGRGVGADKWSSYENSTIDAVIDVTDDEMLVTGSKGYNYAFVYLVYDDAGGIDLTEWSSVCATVSYKLQNRSFHIMSSDSYVGGNDQAYYNSGTHFIGCAGGNEEASAENITLRGDISATGVKFPFITFWIAKAGQTGSLEVHIHELWLEK